ncbi:hypothetical protein HJC23_012961 [Cyclotella cryptica]|uniref:Ferroxidase n=1 Tax=Cyclotella cryptica TaxID=29204 RepID=A0ABD3QI79_9STRA|eukprot:CCRYP_005550-RA/>CCRYP_005550-RA protein AED:0.18 eAED:0.13 QI:0/-1/0/1/-1/1/1/0/219
MTFSRSAFSAVSSTVECSLLRGKFTGQRQRFHAAPPYIKNHSTTTSRLIASPSNARFYLMPRATLTQNHLISQQIRLFRSVGEYHNVADDTLHCIQDAVEKLIEDKLLARENTEDADDIPEVNYASGVLTIYLPPHGTWVINKQTPNEQLWWSSPISGPRRYEYIEGRKRWVYTRVSDGGEHAGDVSSLAEGEGEEDTLGQILVQEIKELYGCDLELEA